MSGSIANRPFGVGAFGTGPYGTYAEPTIIAGAEGGLDFGATAAPGVTYSVETGGSLLFGGSVALETTWPQVQLCGGTPGIWSAGP
jgi:hypothetical protein